MIQPDYNILNQRGTPMFFSDVFANRPTAGIVGRIFISTDTKEFYRDTGSTWELIGGPGSGTITGSGTIDVVAKFTGASSIGNSNIVLSSGGTFVNTAIGSTTGAGNTYDNLQVLATTESTLNLNTGGGFNTSFFNSIGNLGLLASYSSPSVNNYLFYYAGASLTNRYLAFQTEGVDRLTINQSGQTYVGAAISSSGLLTINNSSADAHVQVVGANSPSIRIDNAGTGATQRFVMGLSTAINNFIQGSNPGDICISTASASPMLFGMWQSINASEVMRLTTANNVLIGSNIDFGVKLYVNGRISAANSITVGDGGTGLSRLFALSGSDLVFNAGGDRMVVRQTGNVGINTLSPSFQLDVNGTFRSSGAATFSNSVTAASLNTTSINVNNSSLETNYTADYTVLRSNISATRSWQIDNVSNAFQLYMQSASAYVFNISTTGAATFSSTITTNAGVIGNASNNLYLSSNTSGGEISFWANQLNTRLMTLTGSGNLGIGTSSPSELLNILGTGDTKLLVETTKVGTDGNSALQLKTASDGNWIVQAGNAVSGGLRFVQVGFGEIGRFSSSGNLLVGTSVDSGDRVNINGSIRIPSAFYFRYDGDTGLIGSGSAIGGGSVSQLGIRAASDILFATNGANQRMIINSAGNVGIGVTPSAWRNIFNALQIGYTGAVYSIANGTAVEQVNLASNYYQDSSGNELRIQSGFVTRYQQQSGEHRWSTAGNSTAGSYITFTQAMTLTADGNLGLGSNNPTNVISGTERVFKIAGSNLASMYFESIGNGSKAIYINSARRLVFYDITSSNTDMIITENSNILIGTTSDSGNKLRLNGSLRIDGQTSGTAGGSSGQHLIINCDGTTYKIALLNP